MPLFVGELAGARVIQVGAGTTDCTIGGTQDVLLDLLTQDVYPGQGGGSVMFQQINVSIRHTNGYAIGVTPIVNGKPDTEQTFQSSSLAVGSDGTFTVKAPFRLRGERCAARVRQLFATDVVEVADVAVEYVGIRATSAS